MTDNSLCGQTSAGENRALDNERVTGKIAKQDDFHDGALLFWLVY